MWRSRFKTDLTSPVSPSKREKTMRLSASEIRRIRTMSEEDLGKLEQTEAKTRLWVQGFQAVVAVVGLVDAAMSVRRGFTTKTSV